MKRELHGRYYEQIDEYVTRIFVFERGCFEGGRKPTAKTGLQGLRINPDYFYAVSLSLFQLGEFFIEPSSASIEQQIDKKSYCLYYQREYNW